MALNIEDPETDRLARALADATGESIEAAVKTAIEQRLTWECPTERERKLKPLGVAAFPVRKRQQMLDQLARLVDCLGVFFQILQIDFALGNQGVDKVQLPIGRRRVEFCLQFEAERF